MDYTLLKDNVVVGHGSSVDPDYQPPEGLTLGPPGGAVDDRWDGKTYRRPFSSTVDASPRFCVLPTAFTRAECDEIIAAGNALSIAMATVVPPTPGTGALTGGSPRHFDPAKRRSGIGWFRAERPGNLQWVFDRIWALAQQQNAAYFGYDISRVPDLQFTTYEATQRGHFDWHTDALTFSNGLERKISVVISLSEMGVDFEGGAFEMDGIGALELGRGSALLFSSPMLHRVTPVTKGKRYSLVTWVTGPAA